MDIKIPDSVTSFGDGAFEGCDNLAHIDLPDYMTYISDGDDLDPDQSDDDE